MSDDELREIEEGQDGSDIPALCAEIRRLRGALRPEEFDRIVNARFSNPAGVPRGRSETMTDQELANRVDNLTSCVDGLEYRGLLSKLTQDLEESGHPLAPLLRRGCGNLASTAAARLAKPPSHGNAVRGPERIGVLVNKVEGIRSARLVKYAGWWLSFDGSAWFVQKDHRERFLPISLSEVPAEIRSDMFWAILKAMAL